MYNNSIFFFTSGCVDARPSVLLRQLFLSFLSFLLFLLMLLFYSESASFFAAFVLVAHGRFINPFNEIEIKQKMGKKKVVLQVHTLMRMRTKQKSFVNQ